ncbi:MAG: hypothetical protein J6W52_06765 [Bacteroidaceae bacterium]|nr:hypothetical protein [Bacteroidaceae bacterium]
MLRQIIIIEDVIARKSSSGCGSKLIIAVITIFVIIVLIGICKSASEGVEKANKVENVDLRENNQSEISSEYPVNSTEGNDVRATEPSPSVETTPVSEDNADATTQTEEASEQSPQEAESTVSTDDPEQEQHLSRKERRALRKAQKRLEKEKRKNGAE